jgi:hypothetical protein
MQARYHHGSRRLVWISVALVAALACGAARAEDATSAPKGKSFVSHSRMLPAASDAGAKSGLTASEPPVAALVPGKASSGTATDQALRCSNTSATSC